MTNPSMTMQQFQTQQLKYWTQYEQVLEVLQLDLNQIGAALEALQLIPYDLSNKQFDYINNVDHTQTMLAIPNKIFSFN